MNRAFKLAAVCALLFCSAAAYGQSVDLGISNMTDNPDQITLGTGNIVYTISTHNFTATAASNAVLTNTIPSSSSFVSASSTGGGSCSESGGVVTCTWASHAAGATLTTTITVTPTAGGVLTNSASVSATGSDPVPANNSDTETTTVNAQIDLGISSLSDSPNDITLGTGNVQYFIGTHNYSTSKATNALLTINLPASSTFVSATTTGSGTCSGQGGVVTCSWPNQLSGNTFSTTVTITPGAAGTNTLSVSVAADQGDPVPANNSDSETTTVNDKIDLGISSLSDSPNDITLGTGNVQYFIGTHNYSTSKATNAVLTVNLPASSTYVSATTNGSGTCTESGGVVTCTWANQLAGNTFSTTVTITPGAAGTNTLSASLAATQPDPVPANNSDSEATTVNDKIDLGISSLSDSPNDITLGTGNVQYFIGTHNYSTSKATNVVLTVNLPASSTYVSATTNGSGTCTESGGVVSCTWANHPAGNTFSTTVTVTPGAAGTNTLSASLAATQADPVPLNNGDTEATTVNDQIDLGISSLSDSPNDITLGTGNVQYFIGTHNYSTSKATNAVLTVNLPASSTYVSATTNGSGTCTESGGVVTCTWANHPAGNTFSTTITATPGAAGTNTLSASLAATQADPNPANNNDTETTTVNGQIDLGISSLSDSPNDVTLGAGNVQYFIGTHNYSTSKATNAVLTVNLPASSTYVSATTNGSGSCTESGGVVTCTWANHLAGSTFSTTVTITPGAAGTNTLSASVAATETDSVPANNTDTETTTVNGQIDLGISSLSDSPNDVTLGAGNVQYFIGTHNYSTSKATNAVLTVNLPASSTYVSATTNGSGTCTESGGVVTCTWANHLAGSTLSTTVTITPGAGGTNTLTASVAATQTDPLPANNSDSETTTVNAQIDLGISSLSDSPNDITLGTGNVQYFIGTHNYSSSKATNAVLTVNLPASSTYVSGTTNGSGTCTEASGVVTCTWANHFAGNTLSTTITVTPGAGGTNTLTAGVSATQTDPVPANNNDTETTTVNAQIDLGISSLSDSPASLTLGSGNVQYFVGTHNYSTSKATNAVLSVNLPASSTFVSATTTGSGTCSHASGVVTCSWANHLSSFTFSTTVTVTPGAQGTNTLTATVSATQGDPVPANNTDTETTTVNPTSAPVISSFTPSAGPAGTTVTLSGANFTGSTLVKFNGISATFTVVSDSSITATVPAGNATGPITVTNAVGTGTSSTNFSVGTRWINSAGGNWSVGSNWSTGAVPAPGSDVLIDTAGTYTVNLDVNASLNSLKLGVAGTNVQTLAISGGHTLTLGAASSVVFPAVLRLDAGTRNGVGTLTVNGTFNWNGGTLDGSGVTLIAATGAANIGSAADKILSSSHVLRNTGTIRWTGGNLVVNSSSLLDNQASALFSIESDGAVTQNYFSGSFTNSGTLRKSVTTGQTTFTSSVPFTSTNLIDVQTGILEIQSGGTHSGTFDTDPGATLRWSANSTWNGVSITGEGCDVVAGVQTIGTNATATKLRLSGGAIAGAGTLTVSDTMTWTGGAMDGGGTTSFPAGATLNITGAADKYLSTSRVLSNAGTIHWIAGNLILNSSSVLANQAGGLFSIECDLPLTNNYFSGSITNAGTMRKSGTAGQTTISSGVPFTNSGLVQVQSGTLELQSGGTQTGTFDTALGATLRWNGGAPVWNAVTFTGAGTEVVNGTVTVTGDSSTTHFSLLGGLLGGTGTFTVNGTMTWVGGSMDGSGVTLLPAGATLNITGAADKYLSSSRVLRNAGTIHWMGGNLLLNSSSLLENQAGALFSIECDASLTNNYFAGSFANAGTVRKSSSGLTLVTSGMPFSNAGTVDIEAGAFEIQSGGTHSGTFETEPGTLLRWNGSAATWNSVAFTGEGCEILSGTMNVAGDSTATKITLLGGTIAGTAMLTISDTMTWSGGVMEGAGVVFIPATATLDITGSADKYLTTSRVLRNAGAIHWRGGHLVLNSSSLLENLAGALFSIECDANLTNNYFSGSFTNAGTVRKSVTTGLTTITGGAPFTNNSLVEIQTGILEIQSGGTQTGTFDTLPGTRLRWNGGTSNWNAVTFSGEGCELVSGTVNVTANSSATKLNMSGGTITGTATLTVTNVMDWSSGLMEGAGTTFLPAGSTINITGPADKYLTTSRILRNAGTLHWTGGNLVLNSGSVLENQAGALFSIESDAAITSNYFNGTFTNAGTIRKSLTTGTTTVTGGVPLNTTGTIDLLSGVLEVQSALSLQATSILNVVLGGTTPGTGFSQLRSSGLTTLGGTLNVALPGQYVPLGGDAFLIVASTNRTGDFATKNLPALPDGKALTATFIASGLQLSVTGGGGDLSVTTSSSAPSVAGGTTYSYTVNVTNHGPDPASNVTMSEMLTGGGTITGVNTTGWTCSNTATTVNCSLASLNPGAAPAITINVTAPSTPSTVTSAVTVSGSNDPSAANNSASASTIVTGTGDLSVIASASAANVRTNGPFTFTVQAANSGPDAATNVVMNASITSGTITGVTAAGGWSCVSTATTVQCTASTLGSSATVTIAVTASLSPGTSTINANITASNDPNGANNSSSATVNVVTPVGTVTVSSNADSGPGTFRQAIEDANSGVCSAPCSIHFNLPSGQQTITVYSALPSFTVPVVIDGTTQPGFTGTPVVELTAVTVGAMPAQIRAAGNGEPAPSRERVSSLQVASGSDGLTLTAGNSTVRGLVINGFPGSGIFITGGGGNTIQGNYIGTDVNGTAAAPNGFLGVAIGGGSASNTIGGTGASHGNLISGNVASGIGLVSAGSGNQILGNRIGTNRTGTAGLGNGGNGVYIDNNTPATVIGGTASGARNIISGNGVPGAYPAIYMGIGTNGTQIAGNYVGTDISGSFSIPNGKGIMCDGSTGNTIGGSSPGASNLISGNFTSGVILINGGSGNTVQGNYIGTNAPGTAGVGNQFNGVYAEAANNTITGNLISGNGAPGVYLSKATATGNTIQGNLIGTDASGAAAIPNSSGVGLDLGASNNAITANTIGLNTKWGVVIVDTTTGNSILGNSIFGNPMGGIDLGANGATLNDPGDSDTGPNNLQNTPVIQSATLSGSSVTVAVNVDSSATAAQSIRVELFKADGGSNQGRTLLGFGCFAGNTVNGGTIGPLATLVGAGDSVVTTATTYTGPSCTGVRDGTSEFSAAAGVSCLPPDATITAPNAVCAGSAGHVASVPPTTGATYNWSITNGTITGGQGTSTINFNAGTASPATISVTVTVGTCSNSGSRTVTINPAPDASITPSGATTFCTGGSVTLTASNGTSWLWSNDATTQSITVTTGGSFNVTVTDANGCRATSPTVTVTVNPAATTTITGPGSTCAGQSVTLDAGPGFATYSWSTGQTTQTIAVAPTSATTYNVTVKNASGCTATASHTVNVGTAPDVTITAPASVCSGTTGHAASVPAGAATYAWTATGATITSGQGTNAIRFAVPASPGTVTLSVSASFGCSASSSKSVTVNSSPAPVIAGPSSTCAGQGVTLDAGAGFTSYAWSTGQTTQTITVTPAIASSYSVTVTNATGCSGSDSHTVEVAAAGNATITAPGTVCANSSATASVAPQASATYLWTITGGTISSGQGTPALTFTAGQSGSVLLGVTVTAGACTATGSANVPISAPPAVTIGGPSSVCPNTPFTLSAGSGFATYQWSNGATSQSITLTQAASSATYSVTVTSGAGCSNSASKTVTLSPGPNATITLPSSAENGQTGLVASVPPNPAGATYAWSMTGGTITAGQGTNQITFTVGNDPMVSIGVTVTTGGCTASGSAALVLQPAEANLNVVATAPPFATPGSALNWSVTVGNDGPAQAANVNLTIAVAGGATVSTAGGSGWTCNNSTTTVNCTAGTHVIGSSVIAISGVAPAEAGTVTLTASVGAGTPDPNAANNESTASTTVRRDPTTPPPCASTPPSLSTPADGASNLNSPVTFTWGSELTGARFELYVGAGSAAPSLVATTTTTSATLNLPSGTFVWFVMVRLEGDCPALTSAQRTFTVTERSTCTGQTAPALNTPLATQIVSSPVAFSWTAVPNAIGYQLWIELNGNPPEELGTTEGATTLTRNVAPGSVRWYVDAFFPGCPAVRSAASNFTVRAPDPCAVRPMPTLLSPLNDSRVASSAVDFRWTGVTNASGYRVWTIINDGAPQAIGETEPNVLTLQRHVSTGTVRWFVEALFAGCLSTESERFTFTNPPAQTCGVGIPSLMAPLDEFVTNNANVTFSWLGVPDAIGYEVYLALESGTPVLIGSTSELTFRGEVPAGRLQWFVRALFNGCPPRNSQPSDFTYEPPALCVQTRPLLDRPSDETEFSPVNFNWSSVGALEYRLFLVPRGVASAVPELLTTTSANHALNVRLTPGTYDWFVEARFGNGCPSLQSTTRTFTVSAPPLVCTATTPGISGPSEVSSDVEYEVSWSEVAGATYLLQEAQRPDFSDASNFPTSATNRSFEHPIATTSPQLFLYRVRSVVDCPGGTTEQSTFSDVLGIFLLPVKPPASATETRQVDGATPAGNPQNIQYTLTLDASLVGQSFTATPNQPWLTVVPSSGVVPPGGRTLVVTAHTEGLQIGTSLGGVTITMAPGGSGRGAVTHQTKSTTTTVSVNLVTPVSSNPKSTPPPDALIIPAVAHADGVNSKFQSDVRVTNTSPQVVKYQLTFTPSGENGLANGRQTTVEIEPGRTMALDDVLKSWFGSGTGNSTGTLEVRPLTLVQTQSQVSASALTGALANLSTFASSRTFNVTEGGTFGQYIPAIPFANFVGRAADASRPNVLSLQQVAASNTYRTNFGVVEGSGSPVSLLVSVFGGSGAKVADIPIDLKGGQHMQTSLGVMLAQRGITELADGRMEVRVTSPGGKVTAYASVLDNQTGDPLLVTPTILSQAGSSKYVIAGVADLNNGTANWRTDARVFNAGTQPAEATLSFYSQNGGEPRTAKITLAPGQVRQLDSTLSSLFGVTNDGGALHISTPSNANLVATARTYNQTTVGTFGQFISAVTPGEAIGAESRPLQILQVEESDRFRSNIGIAEVTGKPARVQITAIPPDSKVSAVIEMDLGANQFRQLGSLLKQIGFDSTYNARVTVKVIGGTGRVTAYASVIDMLTQDPTFVPAQ